MRCLWRFQRDPGVLLTVTGAQAAEAKDLGGPPGKENQLALTLTISFIPFDTTWNGSNKPFTGESIL